MKFVGRNGDGVRWIAGSFGGAIARDRGDFFRGNAGFLGDGLGAAKAGRMRKPLLAPFVPLRWEHVELRKFEECRDGGAGVASEGDRSGVGGILESSRDEIGKSSDGG